MMRCITHSGGAANLLVNSPASNDGGMLKTGVIVPPCHAGDKQTRLFWA